MTIMHKNIDNYKLIINNEWKSIYNIIIFFSNQDNNKILIRIFFKTIMHKKIDNYKLIINNEWNDYFYL